jgi:hypothetical protein
MKLAMQLHVQLEQALYEAFPRLPLPPIETMAPTSFLMRDAKELLSGKAWPEAIGYRLLSGDMDINPSIWMKVMPAEVFDYYVASHLMLGSILLGSGGLVNYQSDVMEAFLLPPEGSSDAVARLDEVLMPDTSVSEYGPVRLAFYHRLTPRQRACIGRFLDLYLSYRREMEFTEEGVQMFERNRDYWLNSSR